MGDAPWARIEAPSDAAELIASSPLFMGADSSALAGVKATVSWILLKGGHDLFEEGDAADAAYLLARGRIDVHSAGKFLQQLGAGQVIGEAGLLGSGERSATATAVRDTVLMRFDPHQFEHLAATQPAVARRLAAVVAERLSRREAAPRRLRAPQVVALLSPDGRVRVDELAWDLAGAMPRGATSRVATTVETRGWMAEGNTSIRLVEAEADSTIVLAAVDGDETSSSEILRQADLILVSVGVDGPDARGTAALAELIRPVELLVHRPSGSRPRGLRAELPATHMETGNREDLSRLARRLTGRAVGLVLGGGGARGFAHIGAIRAIREAGIPIDLVGGSSMGAIMAAQVAMGWSPSEMLEMNRRWSRRIVAEPAIPTVALARGSRVAQLIGSFFEGRNIEDLLLPFFCTTADLTTYSLHVATRGPVAEWVSASAAVPGLWPPFVDAEGHLHADGGMLDNVPTAVMRSRSAGPVVAADVCARQAAMRVEPTARASVPSPLRVPLRAAIRSGSPDRPPGVLDLVNRGNLLASLQAWEHSRDHADLYLTPDTAHFGFGSFDQVSALAELGYRSAARQIETSGVSALLGDQAQLPRSQM